MAEFKHGTMDVKSHEKTFNGFVKAVSRTVVVIFVALILLAMING